MYQIPHEYLFKGSVGLHISIQKLYGHVRITTHTMFKWNLAGERNKTELFEKPQKSYEGVEMEECVGAFENEEAWERN
jgi:hypothetical protein